jgi:hypothetical protein
VIDLRVQQENALDSMRSNCESFSNEIDESDARLADTRRPKQHNLRVEREWPLCAELFVTKWGGVTRYPFNPSEKATVGTTFISRVAKYQHQQSCQKVGEKCQGWVTSGALVLVAG